MYQDEINTETVLRYLRNELTASAKAELEQQLEERELWRDHLDYVQLLIEELDLKPEDSFDLCLITISYEIRIREEKVKAVMENYLYEKQAYLELESEIDTLLERIERQVKEESGDETPIKAKKKLPYKTTGLHLKPFTTYRLQRFWNNLIANSFCFIGRALQSFGQYITLSRSEIKTRSQPSDRRNAKTRISGMLLHIFFALLFVL